MQQSAEEQLSKTRLGMQLSAVLIEMVIKAGTALHVPAVPAEKGLACSALKIMHVPVVLAFSLELLSEQLHPM